MTAIELSPGETVGRLKLVLRHVPPRLPWEDESGVENAIWVAECKCGETAHIAEEKLIAGQVEECRECNTKRKKKQKVGRMPKKEEKIEEPVINLIDAGTVLGKLTVTGVAEDSTCEYPKWVTICECGTVTTFSQRQLVESRRPVRRCVTCHLK